MDHCDDCDVCISDHDHHCVFFGKCIGGGNIYCFYGSIVGLIFNFMLVAFFVVYAGTPHGNSHKKVVSKPNIGKNPMSIYQLQKGTHGKVAPGSQKVKDEDLEGYADAEASPI